MPRDKGTQLLREPAEKASAVRPAVAQAPKPAVGMVLARRYELVRELGQGAMGSVFAAHDRELDEDVAIKILRDGVGDSEAAARFRREVKLARRVTHRNVARTFELGQDAGLSFITMELVNGQPLSTLYRRDRKLPPSDALPIFLGICDGLEAAHSAGVVHRDIKPDNVLIEVGGRVVVTDFGIAGLSEAALQDDGGFGTPAYVAPEQAMSEAVTARADQYALGVLMFEGLTGERPWSGGGIVDVLMARIQRDPPNPRDIEPSLSPVLANVILRCMARDPAGRYPDARAVATALLVAIGEPAPVSSMAAPSSRGAFAPRVRSRSIAVTPFATTSGDKQDENLALALGEDLADTLSSVRGLSVLSHAAVLKRSTIDPRDLGVDYLLTGSIRPSPTEDASASSDDVAFRVVVRLVEAQTELQRWSGRFEVARKRVLTLADSIASAVADELASGHDVAARPVPTDPRVQSLYIRARREMRVYSGQAHKYLEEALALEPDNAILHSTHAVALLRAVFAGNVDGTTVERARASSDRAIEIAPRLGEPHLARAYLCHYTGDIAGCARAVREAVARSPSLAEAHELLGRLLLEAGRVVDGLQRFEVALRLDPDLFNVAWDRIRLAALEGEWDRYDRLVAAAPQGGEGAFMLRLRYAMWRRNPTLFARMESELIAAGGRFHPRLQALATSMVDVFTGRKAPAQAFDPFDGLIRSGFIPVRLRLGTLQLKAELAAFVGDVDTALATLRELAGDGLFDIPWLDGCPLLEATRARPEMEEIRARVLARSHEVIDAVWEERRDSRLP